MKISKNNKETKKNCFIAYIYIYIIAYIYIFIIAGQISGRQDILPAGLEPAGIEPWTGRNSFLSKWL